MIDFDKLLGPRNSLPPSDGLSLMLWMLLFWGAIRWTLGAQYFIGSFGHR